MTTTKNWEILLKTTKEKDIALYSKLSEIYRGALENILENGGKLTISDNALTNVSDALTAEENIEKIKKFGERLINSWPTSPFDMYFSLNLTDNYPNCVFVVLILFLFNLDGVITENPEEKIPVHIKYKTNDENDTFGRLLPLISEVYPWVEVSVKVQKTGKNNFLFSSEIFNSLEKFLSDIFY